MNNTQKDIFEGLNEPQMQAVKNYKGPTLIIAGAGSGKTRTLTCRIANMINQGVNPWNILALTFTNKAAKEMRERIKKTVPAEKLRGIYMGTFHGVFRRLIAENAHLLGFPTEYTIYDTADSRNLIKQIVKELELPDEFYKPQLVGSRISLAKNNLMLPDVYSQREALIDEDRQMRCPKLHEVYSKYFQRCKQAGAMDFDDILLYMNILLRDFPQVAEQYGTLFQYILVDEYQDTNSAQYLILKRLASGHRNICVVGDDSQSIYSFRGAKIENILRFQSDYSESNLIKLEQNYRSTANIVDAANSLIEHNNRKLPKRLFSANEQGEKIRVRCCFNDRNEAEEVSRAIQNGLYQGETPDRYAILYRTNSQSRVFEDALRHRSIPYKIYGGQSFYQRAEIKDLLGYIKLAVNPQDDQAFLRVINFPARGIGGTSLAKLTDLASSKSQAIMEVLQTVSIEELGIRGTAVKGLNNFKSIFNAIKQDCNIQDAYEFANQVALRSGVLQHFQTSKLIEDQSRLENVEELLNSIKEYVDNYQAEVDEEGNALTSPTIGEWLSEVSLLTDQDMGEDDTPRVTLLTVHASKGLEFGHTFIVGMEENLFPSGRAGSEDELEEERRVFYVAMTRAEKSVSLSFAQSRFRYGETIDCLPSRFLAEIDEQYLDGDVDMAVSKGMRTKIEDDSNSPLSKQPQGVAAQGGTAKKSYQPKGSSIAEKLQGNVQRASAVARSMTSSTPNPAAANSHVTRVAKATDSRPIEGSGDLKVGARVSHARFGEGVISAMESAGGDVRITVNFNVGGNKTLLQKFAKLVVL